MRRRLIVTLRFFRHYFRLYANVRMPLIYLMLRRRFAAMLPMPISFAAARFSPRYCQISRHADIAITMPS